MVLQSLVTENGECHLNENRAFSSTLSSKCFVYYYRPVFLCLYIYPKLLNCVNYQWIWLTAPVARFHSFNTRVSYHCHVCPFVFQKISFSCVKTHTTRPDAKTQFSINLPLKTDCTMHNRQRIVLQTFMFRMSISGPRLKTS